MNTESNPAIYVYNPNIPCIRYRRDASEPWTMLLAPLTDSQVDDVMEASEKDWQVQMNSKMRDLLDNLDEFSSSERVLDD